MWSDPAVWAPLLGAFVASYAICGELAAARRDRREQHDQMLSSLADIRDHLSNVSGSLWQIEAYFSRNEEEYDQLISSE